jgi:hypothetical protein
MANVRNTDIHEENFPVATPQNASAVAEHSEGSRTPLPKFQLALLMLIQFSEPITALVIYPFINQFVRLTGITGGDDRKTGYYAGIIVSDMASKSDTLIIFTYFRNLLSFLLKAPLSFTGVVCPIALAEDLCCSLLLSGSPWPLSNSDIQLGSYP